MTKNHPLFHTGIAETTEATPLEQGQPSRTLVLNTLVPPAAGHKQTVIAQIRPHNRL